MSNTRFTTFEEDQPILMDKPIADAGQGKKVISETLNSVAQKSIEIGASLAEEASSSMYLASQANISELKNNSYLNMMKNPEKAEEYAQLTKSGIDSVVENSYVNKGDRERLKYFAQTTNDEIYFKGAETKLNNANLQAKALLYANLPENLKSLQDSAINDPKLFDDMHQALINQWSGALKTNLITGIEYGNTIRSIGSITDRASLIHSLYSKEDLSAHEFHRAISSPLNNDTVNITHLPINESTNYLQKHYESEMDERQVIADCSQGKVPNPQTLMGLPEDSFKSAIYCMQGASFAKAAINAGEPYPAISSRIDELKNSGRILSNQEKGEVGYYNHFFGMLNAGHFPELMAELPDGAAAAQQYHQKANALNTLIDNTKDQDQKQKLQSQSKENYNNYITSLVARGEARHLPANWIQPIEAPVVKAAQLSFDKDADPYQAFKVLDMHSPYNQPYVAASMKTTRQQETLQAVSLMRNASHPLTDSDSAQWIVANQNGKDWNTLQLGDKNSKTDKKSLMNKIVVSLSGTQILNYTGRQPLDNSDSGFSPLYSGRNSAIVEMVFNRVQLAAMSHNDFTMNDSDTYIKDAVSDLSRGYNIISGANYLFNANEIPFDQHDAPFIAHYALNQAYKNFHAGKTETQFQLSIDRNPFTVTMSRDHRLIVMDNANNIVFDQLFTPKTLAVIRDQQAKEEKEQKEKGMKSIEESKLQQEITGELP